MKKSVTIFWFRRDLRLQDNAALYHALHNHQSVLPIFIFDKNILNQLEDKADRRITFIHSALHDIQDQLVHMGSSLEVYYGFPIDIFQQLLKKYSIQAVYANHDYEPYALQRDKIITTILQENSIPFHTYKDQVIFERKEVIKEDGNPYTIFTPYSKRWKQKLSTLYTQSYPTEKYSTQLYKQPAVNLPTLLAMGFQTSDTLFPSRNIQKNIIEKYSQQRDYPALEATSRLSVHLRFGTVSIRQLVQQALQLNETFLNELIWRDFYQMILANFPQVGQGKAFKPAYDDIEWVNNKQHFEHWCNGQTGYPIVDAGMRALNATGFMHNRVRMITASFLTKHLLIDWRWGEAYFATKLLDFDFAANNGGWQWAAGSGCDAAPYFRIFNPTLQTQKFDKDMCYIQKWIPELYELSYPKPIVNHEIARKKALEVYGKALKK